MMWLVSMLARGMVAAAAFLAVFMGLLVLLPDDVGGIGVVLVLVIAFWVMDETRKALGLDYGL